MLATKHAPSTPNPTDTWEPTNEHLWQQVLEVASGDRRQLTINQRTINSPNQGRGFRDMPQNPMGMAWAVKQYNGFGGAWRGQRKTGSALGPVRIGAVAVTTSEEPDHLILASLQTEGLVRLASVTSQAPFRHYWEATQRGARLLLASLGAELQRRMTDLLKGDYDAGTAAALGQWLGTNFRIESPKTPPGQKPLKSKMEALLWYLKHGGPTYRASIEQVWNEIQPLLPNLVKHFTDEGGKIVPKDLTIGNRVYLNAVGLDEATFQKYVSRLEVIFRSLQGWRAKAATIGTLKIVLASPRAFHGTASGKYKSLEDTLNVRATPNVLKRAAGYGSFEYVLVHELGHRYEFKMSPPDVDSWYTTAYSHKEGEAFAELFAIGHFGLTGPWDSSVVERFERLMKE